MFRLLAPVAAVALLIAQPLVIACNCPAECGAETHSASVQAACCGSTSDLPDDRANCATPCRDGSCCCTVQPRTAAVVTSEAPLQSTGGHQHFLAAWSPADARAPQLSGCLAALDRGPPPRYGGLRTHVVLGVWLI